MVFSETRQLILLVSFQFMITSRLFDELLSFCLLPLWGCHTSKFYLCICQSHFPLPLIGCEVISFEDWCYSNQGSYDWVTLTSGR